MDGSRMDRLVVGWGDGLRMDEVGVWNDKDKTFDKLIYCRWWGLNKKMSF